MKPGHFTKMGLALFALSQVVDRFLLPLPDAAVIAVCLASIACFGIGLRKERKA